MKFEDLKLGVREGKYGKSVGIFVGRNWIPKRVLEDCIRRGLKNIGKLDWSKPRTAKELYCDPEWTSIAPGRQQAIGRTFRLFSTYQILPIAVINPKSSGTKLYVIRRVSSASASTQLQQPPAIQY